MKNKCRTNREKLDADDIIGIILASTIPLIFLLPFLFLLIMGIVETLSH